MGHYIGYSSREYMERGRRTRARKSCIQQCCQRKKVSLLLLKCDESELVARFTPISDSVMIVCLYLVIESC